MSPPAVDGRTASPGALTHLDAELKTARAAGLRVIRFSVPQASPLSLFGCLPAEPAVLWMPASRESSGELGLGAVHQLTVEGAARFAQVRGWFQDVLTGAACPESSPIRAYGGFSFLPGSAAEAPWRGFADGSFVIPRWTYRAWDGACDSRGSLLLTVCGSENPATLREEFETLLGALHTAVEAGPTRVSPPEESRGVVWSEPSSARWKQVVEDLKGAIARGEVQKVVAAQRTELHGHQRFVAADVLRGLISRFPQTTCFGFRRRGSVFLGATPEPLISVAGAEVTTEALAGSISGALPNAAEKLLASSKERGEHKIVVRDLCERLRPLVRDLTTEDTCVKSLPGVLHLQTPLRGQRRAGVDVLSFVEALHPTSAVGGMPRGPALARIQEHEAHARGWYAAPVGWLDSAGDGHFSVALRSGLLFGDTAWLYAGAGIVSDSDPAAEYAETQLKRDAMLTALRSEMPPRPRLQGAPRNGGGVSAAPSVFSASPEARTHGSAR